MSQILVAYDCSEEADKALAHTISIADPEDEILILMVIPEPGTILCSDINTENSINNQSIANRYEDYMSINP